MDFLAQLFDTTGFPRRWDCGTWSSEHGWFHVLSDLGVWSAYVAIPCVLGYFVVRRRDIPFRKVFLLFCAFILVCGTTHLMEAAIFWWPAYRLAGLIKFATAIVSWATVLTLIPIVPRVLSMRSAETLEREITARVQAEQALKQVNADLEQRIDALRASEERFRLLVEGTKDYAIFLLDPTGHIASWNPGAERFLQYKEAEIQGRHFSVFYPAEDIAAGKPQRELQVAAAEGKYEEEGWRLRKDGSRFWSSVVITALCDEQGNLRGYSKVTRDITDRKQAEEDRLRLREAEAARKAAEEQAELIREQRERLRVTLHSIGDGVITTDALGRVTSLNPVAQSLTGWGEEAYGRPLDEIFVIQNEHTRQPADNPVFRVLREGVIVGLANHTVLISKDGTVRPIDDSAAPIRGREGAPLLGVVLVFRDVAERKKADEALRFLVEASAMLAVLVDYKSTLQKVAGLAVPRFADWCFVDLLEGDGVLSRVAVKHSDPAKVELAHELHRRFPPDPTDPQGVWNILRTGQPELASEITDEMLAASVNDADFLQTLRELGLKSYIGVPLRARSKTLGVMVFMTAESGRRYSSVDLQLAEDLAQRAAVALENSRLYAEARDADRRKDEFLAMLAHELRNPLAPISSALEVLRLAGREGPAADQARDVLDRQLRQMVRLVDDLLDVSRISRGKFELRKQRADLATIVQTSTETSRPVIEAGQHHLEVSLPAEPVFLDCDTTRVAQVIANLLNNAAKYCEPGGRIWLTARRQGAELEISVKDTGIGIPADMLSSVFEMFAQVDHSHERSQGGLGIGLTLVKRLVELHGGRVEARSAGPGQGSEFFVRLPVAAETTSGPAAEPALTGSKTSARRKVLVADDNVDAATSLAMLLKMLGHEVRTVHDGVQALEVAQAFQPDMMLLDIGMPRLNGYDTARKVRQQPWGKHVTLAALTGWGQEADRQRTKEAGFNHHLVKPADVADLKKLLAARDEG